MKAHEGVLKELGESTIDGPGVLYSYIEMDDVMLKKIATFRGLNGKLEGALGKRITLYINRNLLVALKEAGGKTYCTEKIPTSGKFFPFLLVVLGIILCLTIIGAIAGIPMLWFGWRIYKNIQAINSGASLPNAVEIPRDRYE